MGGFSSGFSSAQAEKGEELERSFEHLIPLLEEKGVRVPPGEFQEIVKQIFHNFESSVYDRVHETSSRALRSGIESLIEPMITPGFAGPVAEAPLTMLDIGCGTGR